MIRTISFVIVLLIGSVAAQASEMTSISGRLTVQKMASGLTEPWGIAFLPGGGVLITERGGQLLHFIDGQQAIPVTGLPDIRVRGQGGLLDVVAARDFARTRTIFLSYAKPVGGGAATALASARLSDDGTSLENLRDLFVMNRATNSKHHFGGRIVEAPDGTLFLTLGERGDRDEAQNLQSHNGAVVRISRDARPLVNAAKLGGLPEIWSYGHRNPQGAALDRAGRFWVVEHGARGGDEINAIRQGANYGWPVIAYGRHYTGFKIGEGTHKAGMEQPDFYWDPSIAPSGMMIYSGKLWPEWSGDFFIGSLKFDMISRLAVRASKLVEVERLSSPETGRVRDIREAPDGSIWFLSVDNGAAYRITPAN
jgi:glucose/arabinose dehydrogenase